MEKVLKYAYEYGVEKNIKTQIQKKTFHASLFENGLNIF